LYLLLTFITIFFCSAGTIPSTFRSTTAEVFMMEDSQAKGEFLTRECKESLNVYPQKDTWFTFSSFAFVPFGFFLRIISAMALQKGAYRQGVGHNRTCCPHYSEL